jgi:TolB-like protein/DNA-binding winged helix-turn-helix (wHTH) protein/Flp pilus assembly protein TadD
MMASRSFVFRFDDVEAREREFTLIKAGKVLTVEPKAFRALLFLLHNPQRLISKEELLNTVWGDAVVTEGSLTRCISLLRSLLGDDIRQPRYIATVATVGYRFVCKVEVSEDDSGNLEATGKPNDFAGPPKNPGAKETAANPPAQTDVGTTGETRIERPPYWGGWRFRRRPLGYHMPGVDPAGLVETRSNRRLRTLLAVCAGCVLLAGLLVQVLKPAGQKDHIIGQANPGRIQSLAVLPLENLSRDTEDDYFADEMTEALTTDLGKIGELRVISRTSAMQYKGAKKPLQQVGRELNVEAVVEGAVVRSGGRVRITAKLIRTTAEKQLWSETYERDLRDILALQSEVALDITNEIRMTLTRQERASLASMRSVKPEAYEAYLKGRYHASNFNSDGSQKAIDYFHQAIAIDPGYALPYDGLAYSYILLSNWPLPPNQAMPKARNAASKALELDDSLVGAHTSLAAVLFFYDWNWSAAEKELKRALEINPSYAPAHYTRSWFWASTGRFDEAVSEGKRAQELDPLALDAQIMAGSILYYARRYDEAIRQLQNTLAMHPDNWAAHLILGRVYEHTGRLSEALEEFQKAKRAESQVPEITASLGLAYGLAGRQVEARKILASLEDQSKTGYVSSDNIALVYIGLGDRDRAFAWFEKAYAQRSPYLVWLKIDPDLDSVRSDSRFEDLVRRVGLAQ